jgi:amidase/aspartyl-tRNA(Asn)/glutamyl-tRNA(Gln) amidotransferase subunit A
MKADLIATRQNLIEGKNKPLAIAQACLEVAQSPACQHAFIQITPESFIETASDPAVARKALAGLAVSVKDLFDVEGHVTAAGSVVLKDQPPARQDATAIARLASS